jgi:hypothetical protein
MRSAVDLDVSTEPGAGAAVVLQTAVEVEGDIGAEMPARGRH